MDTPTENRDSNQRTALARIWSGFLFGVGFSVALVALSAIVIYISVQASRTSSSNADDDTPEQERIWGKNFGSDARLVIKSHYSFRTEHNLKVMGSVANEGEDAWSVVRINVQLFDQDDQFVGLCSGGPRAPLKPGEARNFVVDCQGDKWDPVFDYTTYTVEIADANYETDWGT